MDIRQREIRRNGVLHQRGRIGFLLFAAFEIRLGFIEPMLEHALPYFRLQQGLAFQKRIGRLLFQQVEPRQQTARMRADVLPFGFA